MIKTTNFVGKLFSLFTFLQQIGTCFYEKVGTSIFSDSHWYRKSTNEHVGLFYRAVI